MKKFFKIVVYATLLVSIAFMAVSMIMHTTKFQLLVQISLLIGGFFGGLYALIRCVVIKAEKIRKGSNNTPIWACLGFFLIEIALAAGCIYLIFHIWSVRDMLNAELSTLLSGAIAYELTHRRKPAKKQPAPENQQQA